MSVAPPWHWGATVEANTNASKKRERSGGREGGGVNCVGPRGALSWFRGQRTRVVFADLIAELDFWGTQRGIFLDRWRACRKPDYDRNHTVTYPQVDNMWDCILGGKPILIQSKATLMFQGGKTVHGDGSEGGVGCSSSRGGGGGGRRGEEAEMNECFGETEDGIDGAGSSCDGADH